MLLHQLRVYRHVGHKLRLRNLMRQLVIAFFDLCEFLEHNGLWSVVSGQWSVSEGRLLSCNWQLPAADCLRFQFERFVESLDRDFELLAVGFLRRYVL